MGAAVLAKVEGGLAGGGRRRGGGEGDDGDGGGWARTPLQLQAEVVVGCGALVKEELEVGAAGGRDGATHRHAQRQQCGRAGRAGGDGGLGGQGRARLEHELAIRPQREGGAAAEGGRVPGSAKGECGHAAPPCVGPPQLMRRRAATRRIAPRHLLDEHAQRERGSRSVGHGRRECDRRLRRL
eukprot:scaffold1313_cov138-Isochrysis_galbana.AAC.8